MLLYYFRKLFRSLHFPVGCQYQRFWHFPFPQSKYLLLRPKVPRRGLLLLMFFRYLLNVILQYFYLFFSCSVRIPLRNHFNPFLLFLHHHNLRLNSFRCYCHKKFFLKGLSVYLHPYRLRLEYPWRRPYRCCPFYGKRSCKRVKRRPSRKLVYSLSYQIGFELHFYTGCVRPYRNPLLPPSVVSYLLYREYSRNGPYHHERGRLRQLWLFRQYRRRFILPGQIYSDPSELYGHNKLLSILKLYPFRHCNSLPLLHR